MSQLIKPFAVIVPAAGRGQRFNQEVPKQYTLLDGMSILELSLDPIIRFPQCLGICLVISREDSQWESFSFEGPELNCIEGGEERFLSVLNGINFWQNSSKTFDFILIILSKSFPIVFSSLYAGMIIDTFFILNIFNF